MATFAETEDGRIHSICMTMLLDLFPEVRNEIKRLAGLPSDWQPPDNVDADTVACNAAFNRFYWSSGDEAVRPIRIGLHRKWRDATGLPTLDGERDWRLAALAAGVSEEKFTTADFRWIRDRIFRWAKSRIVNVKPAPVDEFPPLDQTDIHIMQTLAQRNAIACGQYDLEGVASRRTLSKRLPRLIELDYIAHPPGKKRGYILTAKGKTRL